MLCENGEQARQITQGLVDSIQDSDLNSNACKMSRAVLSSKICM